MFYRILLKDLKHKRGVNFILFLFMILATLFVASSVNNILVVSNATNYCMEKGKIGDLFICSYENGRNQNVGKWLEHNKLVKHFSKNEGFYLAKNNIKSFKGKKGKDYKLDGTILLQSPWNDNMLAFDENGKRIQVKPGYLSMTNHDMEKNNLKAGDKITLTAGGKNATYTLTKPVRDPGFEGDFFSMSRYFINEQDYKEFGKFGVNTCYNYNIDSNHVKQLEKQINQQDFQLVTNIEKSLIKSAYVMPMITASILIVVGVCLILIAFLILRFTIIFTIQEDYKEIGILKAIGIKNFMIKKIYLIKYFVMIVIAAAIGCMLSIPVGNMMLGIVGKNMMMEDASGNFIVNVLCSIFVAMVVVCLCYLCTSKLKKFTAIEAIRSGQNGERYHRFSVLKLHEHKKLSTVLFMAVNDILSNMKRYAVLLLTFAIGTIIIILPLNTITSLKSDEMAKNFLLDLKADVYVQEQVGGENYNEVMNHDGMEKLLHKTEKRLAARGYEAKMNNIIYYTLSFYKNNKKDSWRFMTLQPVASEGKYIELVDGTLPVKENEIAMSEKAMDKLGVQIGDSIYVNINGKAKNVIITASYQNYMQMGVSAFVSSKMNMETETISGYWMQQCYLKNKTGDEATIKQLKKDFPDLEFMSAQEAMKSQLGSTMDQVDMVKYMVILLIAVVNVLITLLMVKIFIMGERGQIAMMRSIGFSLKAVRTWQTIRIGIILVLGILVGMAASLCLNNLALRPVFGLMGATHMKIQVNPLEVYVICPVLLLILTVTAAYISAGSIKKMNLMEINNVD